MDVADAFAAAFNTRNVAGVAACLAENAVARVEGAPFPEEVGRDAILKTSIAYLMDESRPLQAVTVGIPDASLILVDEQDRVDVAIRMEVSGALATSLVYYTTPHCPDTVAHIARAVGRDVAPE